MTADLFGYKATTITTRTITAPAAWASALVNGDFSGLDADESTACSRWKQRELSIGESVVSTVDDAEPRFTKSFRLYGGDAEGGDVLDYVVMSRWFTICKACTTPNTCVKQKGCVGNADALNAAGSA